MPRLALTYTRHATVDLPDRFTIPDRQRCGADLGQQLLTSPSGISVEYYLFADLRSMVIPDEILTFEAEVDGNDRKEFQDPQPHWINASRFAQFMADGVVEWWRANGRSADDLTFSLESDDDGPGMTFLTHTLTITVQQAAAQFEDAQNEKQRQLARFLGYTDTW